MELVETDDQIAGCGRAQSGQIFGRCPPHRPAGRSLDDFEDMKVMLVIISFPFEHAGEMFNRATLDWLLQWKSRLFRCRTNLHECR
jgi:hypothetical protein